MNSYRFRIEKSVYKGVIKGNNEGTMGKSKVTLKPFNPGAGRGNEGYKWAVYFPHDTPGKARRIKRFKLKADATAFRDLREVELLNAGRDGGTLTAKSSREGSQRPHYIHPKHQIDAISFRFLDLRPFERNTIEAVRNE